MDTLYFSSTGRIGEIINILKQRYNVSSIRELHPEQKLDELCKVLQLSYSQFDKLIAQNSPVLRAITGHAFEVVFEYILIQNGYEVIDVGGDSDIDLVVNGWSLQLKTPYSAGSSGKIVQYKTHKTHGAKSEQESLEYYHSVQDFADYLVGLISYDPFQILFLQRDELPTHPADSNRIISPFATEWITHPGLNAFHRIGIEKIDLSPSLYLATDVETKLLPESARTLNLKTDIILNTILIESNFRIWDMAIRGFAREIFLNAYLTQNKIQIFDPIEHRAERGEKSDLTLFHNADNTYRFFQVKGVSTNNCRFNGLSSIVGVETQLTRGRVNDHPTQSRLYLYSDFDYLIIGIDPVIAQRYHLESEITPSLEWELYAIPTNQLVPHHKMNWRLKSLQKLKYSDLQQYRITDQWLKQWKKY